MESLIARFESAGPTLRQALVGLSDADYRARSGPGKWSIQELVVHLQDSDAVGVDRMRRVIAEDDPSLVAFDEDRFIERLRCDAQNIDDAVTLFEVGRRQMARVLRQLAAEDFQRRGIHSESGPMTLQQLIEHFIRHFEHHFAFLVQKRERLGNVAPT